MDTRDFKSKDDAGQPITGREKGTAREVTDKRTFRQGKTRGTRTAIKRGRRVNESTLDKTNRTGDLSWGKLIHINQKDWGDEASGGTVPT